MPDYQQIILMTHSLQSHKELQGVIGMYIMSHQICAYFVCVCVFFYITLFWLCYQLFGDSCDLVTNIFQCYVYSTAIGLMPMLLTQIGNILYGGDIKTRLRALTGT